MKQRNLKTKIICTALLACCIGAPIINGTTQTTDAAPITSDDDYQRLKNDLQRTIQINSYEYGSNRVNWPQASVRLVTLWESQLKAWEDKKNTPSDTNPKTYTVTFKGKNGETLKTQSVTAGSSATAPSAPRYDGYIFDGWSRSFSNVQNNIIVSAQYLWVGIFYQVDFTDGFGQILSSENVKEGNDATPPTVPEVDGYVFKGWDASYSNIQSDTTINAMWEVDVANYDIVDKAISKIPSNKSLYTNDSMKAVEDAVSAVDRTKTIKEQSAVDNYAKEIEDAIAALELKPADYSAVKSARSSVPSETELSKYTDESVKAVKAALEKVVEGKKIDEQNVVNRYAEAIKAAIEQLQLKPIPTVPTEPTEPEVPTEPTEPEEPTEPTQPEVPTEPTEPEAPTEPTEPEQPTEPTDSIEPEQPTVPIKPENENPADNTKDNNKNSEQDTTENNTDNNEKVKDSEIKQDNNSDKTNTDNDNKSSSGSDNGNTGDNSGASAKLNTASKSAVAAGNNTGTIAKAASNTGSSTNVTPAPTTGDTNNTPVIAVAAAGAAAVAATVIFKKRKKED